VPTTSRGAYTRAGADEPDAAIFAAALEFIKSVPARPSPTDLLDPPGRRSGVDWDALGVEQVPDWVDEVSPSLAALREIEPRAPRRWRHLARPSQLPPPGDEWLYWIIVAGRGFGKTWTGSNVLIEWATTVRGDYAVVAPTFGDARKIATEGPSGLIVALGEDLRTYNKADYVLHLHNGSRIVLASADAPDRLRGYNLSGAWLDELSSFGPGQKDLWDQALLPALRIGRHPRMVVTTTPRRSAVVLRDLLERAKRGDPSVVTTRGSTYENAANLSAAFLREMETRYAGTTTGRQELEGEMLDEVEGALVTAALIESTRVMDGELVPILRRLVVGVDPAVTINDTSDACGIVAVGLGGPPMHGWQGAKAKVEGNHLYFICDSTMRGSPRAWALKAIETAEEWAADAMIVETNQGGDLCTTMLRMVAKENDSKLPRVTSVHASHGKRVRAEPVAGVFEQHRAHIVGALPGLEDGLTSWVPGDLESPNELDAAVWAAVGLMPQLGVKARPPVRVISA
jgi:phage terminase large subunit-like protein